MTQPVFIIAILEVVTGMRAATLFAHLGGDRRSLGHLEQVVQFQGFQARRLAFGMGLKGKVAMKAATAMMALSRAFAHTDATLMEINPLVVTGADDDDVIGVIDKSVIANGFMPFIFFKRIPFDTTCCY